MEIKSKLFYLAEALQFCLPFVKTIGPPLSGNMPAVPQEETTDEIPDNETSDNDFTFTANSSHIQSTQVPPTPFSSKSLEYSDILRQQNTHHPVRSRPLQVRNT